VRRAPDALGQPVCRVAGHAAYRRIESEGLTLTLCQPVQWSRREDGPGDTTTAGGLVLSIGEFAFHGGVSVRMLRHYDALGLLTPAEVDPHSGYRRYRPAQLTRLNRLLTLKDLGFTLEQIGPVLDAEVSAGELRAMLLLRRAKLEEQLAADTHRLSDVERRLRMIEKENTMSELTFVETSLPELTVAQRTARVDDLWQVGETMGPRFGTLMGDLAALGLRRDTPTIAWYAGDPAGEGLTVGAAVPVTGAVPSRPGLEAATLEAAERAVTVTHHGDMESISQTWQQLMQYCAAAGLSPVGRCREVYRETPEGNEDAWVTELQQPVR